MEHQYSSTSKVEQRHFFKGLFLTKLQDNGGTYSEEDFNRFIKQIDRGFPQGILDFSCQQIGMNILTKLTKLLRESKFIHYFNLYGNLIRDHGIHTLFQLLSTNPNIKILDIGCNDFTSQAVPCIIDIIKNTEIESLQLGSPGIPWHNNNFGLQALLDILNAIHSLEDKKIKCLGLTGIQMSLREGAHRHSICEALDAFISNNQALESLSIARCGFTSREFENILHGLLGNNHIKFLDIGSNPFCDPLGSIFAESLPNLYNLTYLNVSNCHISSSIGISFAKGLENCPNLIVLDLSHNMIGSEGFAEIAKVLLDNRTLTELDVTDNGIESDVSELISGLIAINPILYSLKLGQNSLQDKTAFSIAASIGQNEGLCKLSLNSCRISDVGAVALAEALTQNTVLRTFQIADNFLTRESGYKLIEALQGNEHLFVIDLGATQIDHFVIKAAHDLCTRNKQIQRERDLEPLKRELVKLSIQRTKMPEAEARLKGLEEQLLHIQETIEETDSELANVRYHADQQLQQLRKAFNETKRTIEDENNQIKNLTEEGEKLTADYQKRGKEISDNIDKEKASINDAEARSAQLDAETAQIDADSKLQEESISKSISELEKLLNEIKEITNDPEKLKDFQEPDLDWLKPQEPEPFYVAEEALAASTSNEQNESIVSKPKTKKKKGKKSKK